MSGLSAASYRLQVGPQLWDLFAQLGPLKCDNWKNSYIALTQPHVDRLRSKGVLCGSRKATELSKPTKGLIQDGGRRPNFWYTDPDISRTFKVETSNLAYALTTKSSIDGMQKTRSKGTWPSLGDLDLNLRTPVNISRTAKATGFKFITQIDCAKWKISSTKVGQKAT